MIQSSTNDSVQTKVLQYQNRWLLSESAYKVEWPKLWKQLKLESVPQIDTQRVENNREQNDRRYQQILTLKASLEDLDRRFGLSTTSNQPLLWLVDVALHQQFFYPRGVPARCICCRAASQMLRDSHVYSEWWSSLLIESDICYFSYDARTGHSDIKATSRTIMRYKLQCQNCESMQSKWENPINLKDLKSIISQLLSPSCQSSSSIVCKLSKAAIYSVLVPNLFRTLFVLGHTAFEWRVTQQLRKHMLLSESSTSAEHQRERDDLEAVTSNQFAELTSILTGEADLHIYAIPLTGEFSREVDKAQAESFDTVSPEFHDRPCTYSIALHNDFLIMSKKISEKQRLEIVSSCFIFEEVVVVELPPFIIVCALKRIDNSSMDHWLLKLYDNSAVASTVDIDPHRMPPVEFIHLTSFHHHFSLARSAGVNRPEMSKGWALLYVQHVCSQLLALTFPCFNGLCRDVGGISAQNAWNSLRQLEQKLPSVLNQAESASNDVNMIPIRPVQATILQRKYSRHLPSLALEVCYKLDKWLCTKENLTRIPSYQRLGAKTDEKKQEEKKHKKQHKKKANVV